MPQRYFLEVAYNGAAYSGFQVQKNAVTIQSEVEKAFYVLQKEKVEMTGSSRTDAGVHALQNFFHFDIEKALHQQFLYKLNAILPQDIVAKSVHKVSPQAHCRFAALSRTYRYFIYQNKNPFLQDRAYYYPYSLSQEKLQKAAEIILHTQNFQSFSKRNTQVKNFECNIIKSEWQFNGEQMIYTIEANRFLRGMVRALAATMLQVGRSKISISQFQAIIKSGDCTKAKFNAPAHGLFLGQIKYPENIFLD